MRMFRLCVRPLYSYLITLLNFRYCVMCVKKLILKGFFAISIKLFSFFLLFFFSFHWAIANDNNKIHSGIYVFFSYLLILWIWLLYLFCNFLFPTCFKYYFYFSLFCNNNYDYFYFSLNETVYFPFS